MRRGDELTPIAELDGYRSEHLAWDIHLPDYVPTEQIGLNVPRLELLARLGGLAHLRVSTYEGDRTQYQAEITGIGRDGSASAGMKSVKQKAALSKADIPNGSGPSLYSEYWWGDATISINAAEMDRKITDRAREGGSLRDAQMWGKLIDSGLRKGVASASKQQLIERVSTESKVMFAVAEGSAVVVTIGSSILHGFGLENFFQESVVKGLVDSFCVQGATAYGLSKRGYHLNSRRLSLIPGYQLDRLVVAQGLVRAKKLVRPIKK